VLPDGQQKYILVRGRPVRNGNGVLLRGTTLDTTEHKRPKPNCGPPKPGSGPCSNRPPTP
jgi:hypothetical protein